MADIGGRRGIEACVTALAGCVGIKQSELSFVWEELQRAKVAGFSPDENFEIARVFLGKCWSTLVFRESETKDANRLTERILARYKDDILETLRRLKGLSRLILESDCPDRWVAEGDAFPGEPA